MASGFLIFTAISINASAALLRALSLRKTSARSRRMCVSANRNGYQNIGPYIFLHVGTGNEADTPTSAATKRFSSSLESSSMAHTRFKLAFMKEVLQRVPGVA